MLFRSLDKVNTTVQSVCVKDADSSFESISSKCDGANETLVTCNNQSTGQYACFDVGNRYRVTGLNHSAVKEECIDNDGDGYGVGCAAGSDGCDTDSSTSGSCPSSGGGTSGGGGSSGSGGGGGGGGAGAGGFVCNHEWQCNDWNNCANGFQTRECNFVKVPQHVQDAECPDESKIPVTARKCAVKKEIAPEQTLKSAEAQQELNKSASQASESAQSPEKPPEKKGLNFIFGSAVRNVANITKTNSGKIVSILIVAVVLGLATIKLIYRHRYLKLQAKNK